MFYPFCERCHTRNNFGRKLCGSCELTIGVAKRVNGAIYLFNDNKEKAMKFLGFSNRNSFYAILREIPEIAQAWDGIEESKREDRRKIFGNKVLNKTTKRERGFFWKVLREHDYYCLPEIIQEKFVNWISENRNELTLIEVKEKLKELKQENVITI
jgi:hypothetical protein